MVKTFARRWFNLTLTVVLVLSAVSPSFAYPSLIVHEWGTITTKHQADGTPVGALNQIEASEVLPEFVHKYEPPKAPEASPLAKSPATPGRPDVTMRLETPVIYFYPKVGAKRAPFQVSVKFRGGVINEFYPNATPAVSIDYERINAKMSAGVIKEWDGKILDNYVVGSLIWNSLNFSTTVNSPPTDMPVWLLPRNVKAVPIMTAGEAEKYLFYRGVAHLDALFRTKFNSATIELMSPATLHWAKPSSLIVANTWAVRIDKNGRIGFKKLGKLTITGGSSDVVAAVGASELLPAETGLVDLRVSMGKALIAAGLYPDEAEAMLGTWNHAYFERPGFRIFYLVPNEWIDHFLPLEISTSAELTRVIIGRIDLLEP